MATTVIARDFQTAQALYQRSLQGELMEVNKQGQIRTASFGTRVVSALIGAFQGADAKDAYVSGKQREVAQAFRALVEAQPRTGEGTLLRDRSASLDTLDGRDISVNARGMLGPVHQQPAVGGADTLDGRNIAVNRAPAESPYENSVDARRAAVAAENADNVYERPWDLATTRQGAQDNPGYQTQEEGDTASGAPWEGGDNPTYGSTAPVATYERPTAGTAEAIPAYAEGIGSSVLNYTRDPALAHLKETAHFVKAEIEQHGSDAGRALQNLGILNVVKNNNRGSTGEILQALTPELRSAYASELARLKGERADRAVGQKAADASYKAASIDNPNLPIHELLNRPLFAQAPIAQRFIEDAYTVNVTARHARGEAGYDVNQPSRDILGDRNIHRDALMAEFGSGNRDSAISKALSGLQVSADKLRDLQGDFDDLLNPQADAAARGSAFADGLSTAQFSAQVDALVAEFMKTARP